jgi:2-polyprenyl-3-methyl-5-hydroxy-6-metoxy-1,4-benzoquinol methylase
MGKEFPASYYDSHFLENRHFQVHYKDSPYYVAWTQVIRFLKRIKPDSILEIGCGTGQLAEYLRDEGFTNYEGFDFAHEAINMARKRVNMNFYWGNALDKGLYRKYFAVVICLEVLEHIEQDLQVLENIPPGTEIIFSVPNFDAPSHVRWFTSPRQLKKRYFRNIDIRDIVPIGNLFICRGTIGKFKPDLMQGLLATREEIKLASFIARLRHRIKNKLKIKSL